MSNTIIRRKIYRKQGYINTYELFEIITTLTSLEGGFITQKKMILYTNATQVIKPNQIIIAYENEDFNIYQSHREVAYKVFIKSIDELSIDIGKEMEVSLTAEII